MNALFQVFIGGVQQGCIFGLLAAGFSLVHRVTGAINLAQGGFAIVAALIAFTAQQSLDIDIIPAAALAVAATSLLALVLGDLAFVPGLARLPTGTMFILTVGMLTFLEGASFALWGSQAYTLPAFSGERPLHLGSLLLPPQGLWLLGATVLVVGLMAGVLGFTRIGFAFRACAENTMAASLMGIGVRRMQRIAFVLAAAMAALAGVVIGPLTSFQFDTGRLYTVFGFIAVVIGGIGSPFGAVAGGLFLGLATQFAAAYVSSLFANALALALLLLMLLWRPTGLFAGPGRRQDVRDEMPVQRAAIRLSAQIGWALAGAALLMLAILPLLLPPALLGSVVIAEILFLAVIGLDVMMGFAGQVNLGQAGFMAIGGYVAGVLAVRYAVPPWLGTLAGIAASLACAMLLAAGTMRLRGLYMAIATLAFGLLADSLTNGLELTGGPSGLVGVPALSLVGVSFDTPQRSFYLLAGILVLVLAALSAGLRRGFGRALQAVRADPLAAAALGIRVRRTRLVAFAISAALGSLAGSLYVFNFRFLSPDMVGTPLSLAMLSMLVIGGEGSLFGPVFGVALITLLPDLFQSLAQYKTMATGALLMLFTLYLPNGVYGGLVAMLAHIPVRRLRAA